MSNGAQIFDSRAARRRRARAAVGLDAHDFLIREVAERLADRLDDVKRRFPLALEIGCWRGAFRHAAAGRGGIEQAVSMDSADTMLDGGSPLAVQAEEEWLPFANESFDLVVSLLTLHQVNDLPGALVQIRRALRPDGLFLGACFGAETLSELRQALLAGESRVRAGAAPRVAPFIDVRDAGALLQRAGFALPVVDVDRIQVRYGDPQRLLADLVGMGESNVLSARSRGLTSPRVLAAGLAAYAEKFGEADGRVPATFDILFLTGWAPHPDQPKPLARGSATASLAEAVRSDENDNS